MMNILISANEKYLPFAKTMLHSLQLTNAVPVHVYLMYVKLSDETLAQFETFVTKTLGMSFSAIAVDYSCFQDMPIGRHYSIEIYNRLLAQYLLPDTLDRILYLDVDIIIRGNLMPFYQQPLNDQTYLVACVDWNYQSGSMKAHQMSLGLSRSHQYFNSGVLLLDLAKLRAHVTAQDVFAVTKQLAPMLKFPDQDILNYMYGEHTLYADENIYNFQAFDLHSSTFSETENVVFHYAGIQKPWQFKFINRYSKYYWAIELKQGHYFKTVANYILAGLYKPAITIYRALKKVLAKQKSKETADVS